MRAPESEAWASGRFSWNDCTPPVDDYRPGKGEVDVSCHATQGVGLDHAGEIAKLAIGRAAGGLVNLQRTGGSDEEMRGAMIARLVELGGVPGTAVQDGDPSCGSDLQGTGAQINGNGLAIEGGKGGQHASRARQVRGVEFDRRIDDDGGPITDGTGNRVGIRRLWR